MQETLKNLRLLITEDSVKLSLEELSKEYKKEQDPTYLATAFEKVFKCIIQISQNFYGLTEDDLASFSLEKLDYCLQTFDESKSKFITYFYNILKNKFREETQYLSMQKRKLNYESTSYDLIIENGYDAPFYDNEADYVDLEILEKQEKMYCELLLRDYTNQEISNILGVSVMTLCNMRKRLRGKFYKNQIFSI
jgi:RNA polymerase sigma factor (sigma-70 family)